MESQKIINLLDDTTNQPSKFRPKNWVEMNDESWGTYNASNQIKFKTSMIGSNLCDYSDAYVHVKGIITVRNTGAAAASNNKNKIMIFNSYVMPMYNLIEYSDTFWKTSECLYQYCRDKPALNNNSNIIDFPNDNNNSILLQFKQQITGQTEKNGTKIVEIVFPLKYLRNFWRTLEMPLIN